MTAAERIEQDSIGIEVRGSATPEEVAAVVAALAVAQAAGGRTAETGYQRWRRLRLKALERSQR
jgi:hypothetical protein